MSFSTTAHRLPALRPRLDGEGMRIETRAEFEVKLLRITAFEYDHRNTELWRDGCLQAIDARTDSNGKQYAVSGRARATASSSARTGRAPARGLRGQLRLLGQQAVTQRRELLNSQTGEYVPVQIDSLGRDRIRIGERECSGALLHQGKELDITLAYDAAAASGWRSTAARRWPDAALPPRSGRPGRFVRHATGPRQH